MARAPLKFHHIQVFHTPEPDVHWMERFVEMRFEEKI